MRTLLLIVLIFLAMTGASTILIGMFNVEFGLSSYWDNHGVWFLIFLMIFPRLTLLFSSVVSGGFFWWVGWLFTPRLLVAIIGTIGYWDKNWFLVVVSWLFVLGGESSEKFFVYKKSRSKKSSFSIENDKNTFEVN